MMARLACSRGFQAFRESSDSVQWQREMESGERKEEERKWKRGGKGLFSPNPTLPLLFFHALSSLSLPHNLKAWNRLSFARGP